MAGVALACAMLALLAGAALGAGGGPAAAGRAPRSGPSPAEALAASAAYPGLGQLLVGSEGKAAVIGAAEGFLVARLVLEDRWTRNALRLYKGTGDDGAYADYSRHFDTRQTLVWWVVVAALYGLADAYVDAELAGFDEPIPPYLGDALGELDQASDDGVRVGFVVRF
jgi:hypothetical protein